MKLHVLLGLAFVILSSVLLAKGEEFADSEINADTEMFEDPEEAFDPIEDDEDEDEDEDYELDQPDREMEDGVLNTEDYNTQEDPAPVPGFGRFIRRVASRAARAVRKGKNIFRKGKDVFRKGKEIIRKAKEIKEIIKGKK